MAKFEILPGLTFADRAGWGADDSLPRLGHRVPREDRTHVIIHHTVTPDASDTSPNLWETEREIFRLMRRLQSIRPDLGMDVPYNFIVFLMKPGCRVVICEGRGEDRTGAHTKGHNTHGIALSFAGNFEDEAIEPMDIAGRLHLVSFFLGWLKTSASHPDYGNFKPMVNLGSLRPPGREVFIHQDFKATACPGKRLIPHLKQMTFLEPEILVA